jgi:hypothetical protein
MDSIEVVLIMLLAVVASAYIRRLLPRAIPLPLVQIALGALIAAKSSHGVDLEPDLFFLVFLPPLLFLDGWRIPKSGLLRDKGTILELAFGLVVFTVIGAGFLIHWLIPAMPLPVAFALAAIVSPTDPIAVSSIASSSPIPKRLMHILEGESLLNDASGLVCFRFAVAAAMTGAFSLQTAALTFVWLVVAGIAAGVGLTLVVTWRSAGWCATSASRRLADPGQPADSVRRLSGGGAPARFRHPGGGGSRHHHELRGAERPRARQHPHPAFGRVGHRAVCAQRRDVRAAGRAAAGYLPPRRRLAGGKRPCEPLVAGGVCVCHHLRPAGAHGCGCGRRCA